MARKRTIQEREAKQRAFGKKFTEPKDSATVEVQLDRHRIFCRICKTSEPLPEMKEMKVQYLGAHNQATHVELRTIIETYKKKHQHGL